MLLYLAYVGELSPKTMSIAFIILLLPELFFPTITFFPELNPNVKSFIER